MPDDNWLKLIVASLGAFCSYVVYGVQRNNKRHDEHIKKHSEHDTSICGLKQHQAVTETRLEHIVTQLDTVIASQKTISNNHDMILKQLLRNGRGK